MTHNNRPDVDLAAPGGIDRLLSLHHSIFGDAVMSATPPEGATPPAGQQSTQPDTPATPPAQPADAAFPADTPWRDMTPEQQVAYWQTQSRKHEQQAKGRSDYDQVKKQLADLQQAAMTDQEKAVTAAREDGLKVGREQAGAAGVDAFVHALASVGRLTSEQADVVLGGMNKAAFLAPDGTLDHDKLGEYLNLAAPAGMAKPPRDPNQGHRQRGGTSRAEQGRAEAARRFGKPDSN